MTLLVSPVPPTYEEERLARLRQQMREQDRLKFADRTIPVVNIYVVCAWMLKDNPQPYENVREWRFITWTRGPLTGYKVKHIRRRYSRKRRFSKHDTLEFIELRVFKAIGGCARMAPPPVVVKRPRRKRLKEAA
jgi:hypothetical protein